MKRLLLLLAIAMTFTACSKDDDDDENKITASIVGEWRPLTYVDNLGDAECYYDTRRHFFDSGLYAHLSGCNGTTNQMQYSVDGNIITYLQEDGTETTQTIKYLNETEMEVESECCKKWRRIE